MQAYMSKGAHTHAVQEQQAGEYAHVGLERAMGSDLALVELEPALVKL